MIKLHTNHGVISIELDAERAPLGAENFLAYANSGHYDGTIFHRVIPGFMIQGGGFDEGMTQKPTRDPIRNEADNGLCNEEATLSWARTSDPHSATAQFFINLKDNDFLDHVTESPQGWGYAVFGRVVDGFDVVKAIAGVKTGNRGMHQDVPLEPVVIERVETG
jgi:peptidyl-prolyl cis-trans isomerase B (cyclophilin B)